MGFVAALHLCYTCAMWTLSPLHPRFVHFPIALLLTGSLVALAYIILPRLRAGDSWPRQTLLSLAWSCLLLGWLAIFPAVLTGLIDQNSAPQNPAVTSVVNQHIAAGFGLIITYGLLLYERLRAADVLDEPRSRLRIIFLLVLGIGLIILEGSLGGKLVYQFGVGIQN